MDAVGRGVDHLLVVGGVGVDVEVEAAGVGFFAEAPDAVAGVFVDPGIWWGLGAGDRGEGGEEGESRGGMD